MRRRRWPAVRTRRAVLAVALLAVAFVSAPGVVGAPQPAGCARCRHLTRNAERWSRPLPGQWLAVGGVAGTVPQAGQAYTAVGGGVAALADGMTVSAYAVSGGKPKWRVTLGGFPAGATIISVRAWPDVITAGVALPAGARTEVVLSGTTGAVVRRYPSALFGGAVDASGQATVIVGATAVTSYDNHTGRQRWQFPTGGPAQAWRIDGDVLYMAQAAGGYASASPVTAVRRIDLKTGAERTLLTVTGQPFAGSLAVAGEGVLLFSGVGGVTAYSQSTARQLWFIPGAVPEGDDPGTGGVYLTQGSSLLEVKPATGRVIATVTGSASSGSAGMYVVRGGVALGLDQGSNGEAWGFDVAAGRVIWTATGLPWPHYFADVSGVGGSADPAGTTVVIAACAKLAPAPATSPSSSSVPATSPASPSPSPTPPAQQGQPCAAPELVALTL